LSARLLIEYDGSEFAGWARQPGLRTVQGELEDALGVILKRDVPLTVAGRTDRGVHARGQVASHDGEPAPDYSLNGVLGDDVRVLESVPAPGGFDARRDALSRTYRYRVFTRRTASPFERGRAWHRYSLPSRAELDAMAASLLGTHDFTAFTPTQTDHVRFQRNVIRAEWTAPEEHVLELWLEADSFMRGMVRALVGTMLSGRHDLAALRRLLEGRPRAEAGDTAPAQGLCLESVRY
jgi:tRNA pseudouridine38-40 synthase